MFVTFFDTCMVSLAAMFVWRISPFIVFFPWLTIACLDGTFISSVLTKVPSGAWFTLLLASVLALFLLMWRFGKEQQWSAEATDRYPTSHFVRMDKVGQLRLSDCYGGTPVGEMRGFGIFFDKAGETTPIVFSQFILKLTMIPEVVVFFHLRPLETPSVAPEERHTVSRLAIPNCYRLVVRYGYNDEVITPNLAAVVAEQVRRYLLGPDSRSHKPLSSNNRKDGATECSPAEAVPTEKSFEVNLINSELIKLDKAYNHGATYIIGKEEMRINSKANWFRTFLLWIFLWVRENTRNKMANLRVQTDQLIEVGFVKEI